MSLVPASVLLARKKKAAALAAVAGDTKTCQAPSPAQDSVPVIEVSEKSGEAIPNQRQQQQRPKPSNPSSKTQQLASAEQQRLAAIEAIRASKAAKAADDAKHGIGVSWSCSTY